MPPYRNSKKYKTGELVGEYYTKEELLNELEEISLERFGSDIEEWNSWLLAWKNDPPYTRYR
jgi:hypothetical protein